MIQQFLPIRSVQGMFTPWATQFLFHEFSGVCLRSGWFIRRWPHLPWKSGSELRIKHRYKTSVTAEVKSSQSRVTSGDFLSRETWEDFSDSYHIVVVTSVVEQVVQSLLTVGEGHSRSTSTHVIWGVTSWLVSCWCVWSWWCVAPGWLVVSCVQ